MPVCLEPQPSLAGETIQLLGSYSVNQFDAINWANISIDSVCAEIPYSQLIFTTLNDGSQGTSAGAMYIDDILLTLDAEAVQLSPPTVSVDAIVPDLCDEGNSISVTYKICAEQDITVDIDASANLSVTAQPASQSINIAAGTCEEVTIVYTETSDLADVAL